MSRRRPEKHPETCRGCGDHLPGRAEPRGRPRLYCPAAVRPCKERQHSIDRLAQAAAAAEAVGNEGRARYLFGRIEALCRDWQAA